MTIKTPPAPSSGPVPGRRQLHPDRRLESRIERDNKIETERRSYISSCALSATAFAETARGHWSIENNLHWTLDVTRCRGPHAICSTGILADAFNIPGHYHHALSWIYATFGSARYPSPCAGLTVE